MKYRFLGIWLMLVAWATGCDARSTFTGPSDADIADTNSDAAPTGDAPTTTDRGPADAGPPACSSGALVDLLFMVDNSNSMTPNQVNLSRNITQLIDSLANPPLGGPGVRSLHVGVVSSDLGTPGATVPSCANTESGDDGLLNPIRNGGAIRTHEPWVTAPRGNRPARCANDPEQYPSFLTFDAIDSGGTMRDDIVCNTYLSGGGCGLEQQLESVYRALVTHNPRANADNHDPNAGFVRDDAVLAILMLTDEEDGSTRDCAHAEPGVPCRQATDVFDSTSTAWSSTDLNLRFYLYQPGSQQDPTWPIDRYVDPTRPARGLTSLKPGHPELVVFGAIAGVPILPPRTSDNHIAWDQLLGTDPRGTDGYTGTSPEGPVSMRQSNPDPACSTRVVPACYREASTHRGCDSASQYFAWPSRRIAQVVRRFDEAWGNGVIGSICQNDYATTLGEFSLRVQQHFCR